MILTLTPSPVLDRILLIDEFCPGATVRQPQFIDKVGGNGLGVSMALKTLGKDTRALGFVAGQHGRRMATLLSGYGVRHDFTWVRGETRISHVLVEKLHHRHSHIIVGDLTVSGRDTADLLLKYKSYVRQAKWVVAGGSLPHGASKNLYRNLVEIAQKANVSILLDVKGTAAESILNTPPSILKMSWEEFTHVFNRPATTVDELINQAQLVFRQYRLPALVITCGKEGMVAFTADGAWRATTPPQPEINAAGAGDNASAALVWRLSEGNDWPEALRWAAAMGAASVLTVGTADCDYEDIERILPQTGVRQLTI